MSSRGAVVARPLPRAGPPAAARRRVSPVALGAAALLLVQAALRGWVGYRGFFFLDDFAFTGRAAQYPLTDLTGYLLHPYNSHLMPAAFAEVWVFTALWPLSFAPVVTLNLVLQGLVGVAFYRLLRELFGTRPAILVPFAVFVFSPITLPAFVWWAAALNQLPQQLAMICALLWQTRYLRTGRVRWGLAGAGAVLLGLLFSEKTILTVPLVAAYTVLWFADGGPLHRLVGAWRAHWKVWLAYLVVSVPYAGYYALEVPSPGRPLGRGADVLALVGSSFAHALDPGLLGGPWQWRQVGVAGGLAAPGQGAAWIAGLLVVGTVIGSIAWYRQAVFGWALAAGYALVTLALLSASRATFIGPLIGDEYRYVTDVAAVAVLGGALAFLRPAGSGWRFPPAGIVRREWPERFREYQVVQDVREVFGAPPPRATIGVLVGAVVLSAAVTTVRYDRYWHIVPARPYVTHLKSDLAAARTPLVLYDEPVPAPVAWALLFPYNQLSKLVAPLPNRPQFLRAGRSVDRLSVVADDGHVRPAAIEGIGTAAGPSGAACRWPLGARAQAVPLSRTTFPWTWVLRLDYQADRTVTASLHAGRTTAPIRLRRGGGAVFVQVLGAVDDLYVSTLPRGASGCVTGAVVGRPVPSGGSS